MSYNKHTWATGNVVGAVDLNRMEQGIEDASGGGAEPLIVNAVLDSGTGTTTCDKTASEIVNAFNSGSLVQIIFETAFEGWNEDVFRNVVYQIHFGKSANETQEVFDSFTIEIVTRQYTYQVYSTTSFEDALSMYPYTS